MQEPSDGLLFGTKSGRSLRPQPACGRALRPLTCSSASKTPRAESRLFVLVEVPRDLPAHLNASRGTHKRNDQDWSEAFALCVDAIRPDRKSTRLNSSHIPLSRMPSSA